MGCCDGKRSVSTATTDTTSRRTDDVRRGSLPCEDDVQELPERLPATATITVENPGKLHAGRACHDHLQRLKVTLGCSEIFEGQAELTCDDEAVTVYTQRVGGDASVQTRCSGEQLADGVEVYLQIACDATHCHRGVELTLTLEQDEFEDANESDEVDIDIIDIAGQGATSFTVCGVDVPTAAVTTGEATVTAFAGHGAVFFAPYIAEIRDANADLKLHPALCCNVGFLVWGLLRGIVERVFTQYDSNRAGFFANDNATAMVTAMARLYVDSVVEVMQRVLTDWDGITEHILGIDGESDDELVHLVRVRTSGSDFHGGGHQVLFLDFAKWAGEDEARALVECKVVYKPRPVKLAYALLADTRGIGDNPSIVELLNQHGGGGRDTWLPTYKILPKNGYGYVEFLSAEQDADRTPAGDDDIRKYFREYGRTCALAQAFAIDDLHFENLRIHDLRPCLTDIEISFRQPIRTTLHNGLLTPTIGPCHIKRATMGSLSAATATSRLVTDGGEPIELEAREMGVDVVWHANTAAPLRAGFAEVVREIWDNAARYTDGLEAHEPLRVRFLTVPTPQYGQRLTAFTALAFANGLAARNDWLPDVMRDQKALEATAYTTPPLDARSNPTFAITTATHDYADYANFDLPAYYRDIDSLELQNARGTTVAVPLENGVGRTTYFPASAWSVLKTRIEDDDNVAGLLTQLDDDLVATRGYYLQPIVEGNVF